MHYFAKKVRNACKFFDARLSSRVDEAGGKASADRYTDSTAQFVLYVRHNTVMAGGERQGDVKTRKL